jgi:hypothetical protein
MRRRSCPIGGYPATVTDLALEELPGVARTAWLSLRDALLSFLDRDLIAMWAHGGTVSTVEPAPTADLDTYVILARKPTNATARQIEAAHEAIAHDHEVEWDAWDVLADDARRADPPRHAWKQGRRDTSWAIHRAHWLAGLSVTLHGLEPSDVVPVPTREDLERDLSRELEHLERHVFEGDTDPLEATYAILKGSRILHTIETDNIAISKRAAGEWALEHLLDRWQPALRAALRAYAGRGTNADVRLIATEMGPFVSFVRERLPWPDRRPMDAVPRWSGY